MSDVQVTFELDGHLRGLTCPLFETKLHLISTVLLGELWNPLSIAVPGKFYGSGGHSKGNCFQDQADFHQSRPGQIVLIFSTVNRSANGLALMIIEASTKYKKNNTS